jgi:hypothetical protein
LDWCRQADLSHCSTRGVHKATSRALVESGATPREIMAITGYQTLEDPERYMDYGDSALNSRESFVHCHRNSAAKGPRTLSEAKERKRNQSGVLAAVRMARLGH